MTGVSPAAVEAGTEVLARRVYGVLPDQVALARADAEAVLAATVPLLKLAEPGELSEVERAAVMANLHMATCASARIVDCALCGAELGAIRRHLAAAAPLLEAATRQVVLAELAEEGRLLPDGCGRRAEPVEVSERSGE